MNTELNTQHEQILPNDAVTAEERFTTETASESPEQESSMKHEKNDLHEQLLKAVTERDEYRDLSMRKVAELENFRRRTEQERSELISYANHKLLLRLLPVLDDLHRAVESGKNSTDYKALLDGIELVYNKTVQTFKDAGVQPIEALGADFNVNWHEALMQMPSEAPEGQILQEAQRGYMYGDKILRHARVVISAGMPENDAESEN